MNMSHQNIFSTRFLQGLACYSVCTDMYQQRLCCRVLLQDALASSFLLDNADEADNAPLIGWISKHLGRILERALYSSRCHQHWWVTIRCLVDSNRMTGDPVRHLKMNFTTDRTRVDFFGRPEGNLPTNWFADHRLVVCKLVVLEKCVRFFTWTVNRIVTESISDASRDARAGLRVFSGNKMEFLWNYFTVSLIILPRLGDKRLPEKPSISANLKNFIRKKLICSNIFHKISFWGSDWVSVAIVWDSHFESEARISKAETEQLSIQLQNLNFKWPFNLRVFETWR